MAILETRDLIKNFSINGTKVEVLRSINLTVEEGEFIALLGPSGSGKSTLMHILGLMDTPTAGEVLFDGQSIGGVNDKKRTRLRLRTIGFIFQTFNLLPTLSSFENVEIALRFAHVSKAIRKRKTIELLDRVGLGHRLSHLPKQLSGGERQRVAIARALANNPKLLLADEPTGNLDSETSLIVAELLQQLNSDGQTIVLVTHDPEIAAYATRTLIMRDGQLV